MKLEKSHEKIFIDQLFKKIRNLGYSRVFVESGLTFLNNLLKLNKINNIFVFKSSKKLRYNGYNNASDKMIRKIKLKDKIKVYLYGDNLYKVNLK